MPKDAEERTVESAVVFAGKFFSVRRHQVIMPDGKKAVREIAEHPGASACVVLDEQNRVLFVRQYRKAAEAVMLEIPAGKLDPGETPEVCAKREVEEETGVTIGELTKLCEFYPSPGFTDEKMYIYFARPIRQGEPRPMEDECIWAGYIPLEEALSYIESGKLEDAKSIIGLTLTKERLSDLLAIS